jgi:hypothetical protein
VKVIDGLGNVVERIERGRVQPADIGTEIRRNVQLYRPMKLGEQCRTRPLGRVSRTLPGNSAKTVKQQNVLTVYIHRNKFLQAIDDFSAKDSAFFQIR